VIEPTPIRPVQASVLTRKEMADELRIGVATFDRLRKHGMAVGLPCPEIRWGSPVVAVPVA
jgi:hypothetical protein